MTDKKWDDNKIEELFSTMPDIQDNRPKSDILARLKQDERLIVPRRKNPKKWMPVLAAVAAMLVIGLLLPSMLRQNDGAMMKETSNAKMATSEKADIAPFEESEESSLTDLGREGEEASTFATSRMDVVSHVVLPGELDGMHTFRIGLTHEANIIPVTFLISDERYKADFPEGAPDSVALYNKYAVEIPETDLGFDDYHPYKGELTLMADSIVHTIPMEHNYDMSGGTEALYYYSVLETFNDHTDFISVDENGDPVVFSHTGITEPKKLVGGKRPMPYFKYVMPSGQFYLVPSGGRDYDSVNEALVNMKEKQGGIIESVIPVSVTYDVHEEKENVVITFNKQLDLSVMNPVDANAMIEAFMLTASNFNKQVRLENVIQQDFGKYDLTKELPEPVGVNPTYFPE